MGLEIRPYEAGDREAVVALLAGIAGSGKPFLHTSGSSIVSDHANGEPSEAVFDEEHMPTPIADKATRAT